MTTLIVVTDTKELVAGAWYCIGVKNLDEEIDWGGSPIYKYEGDGCWSDDARNPVETAWDATLQMSIGINDADAYLKQ